MFEQKDVLTLQAANARLDAIETRRAQFAAASAKNASDLMDAEARLGERFLAGDEDACSGVAILRLKIDGLNAALQVLEKRRAVAQLDCRQAEASDMRRRAGQLRDELSKLEGKTSKALAELSKLEEIQYDACVLASQRTGCWLSQATLLPAEPWQTGQECGPDPGNDSPYAVPRSRRLRDESLALENRARDIEAELAAAVEQVPTTSPAPPWITQATHSGPCFCGPCKRARASVSPNEWIAACEAGANAGE